MNTLTEVFISVCDLAEAEGRLLKHKTLQTAGVLMLMLLAAVFLLMALVLVMFAIHHLLLLVWSKPLAYLGTAFFSFLLTGGLLWLAILANKKQ